MNKKTAVDSSLVQENGNVSEVVNLIPQINGTIKRPCVFGDAVIVQLIYSHDDEITGNPQYRRFISLMVQNEKMKPELTNEARRIMEKDDE